MASKLTDKQERFAREYQIDCNATKAAIRAGYSAKTAESIGRQLLRKTTVAEKVKALQAKQAERIGVTADMVIEELRRVAFANMKTFAKWGTDRVDLLDSDGLSDEDAAAVAEVRQTVTQHGGSMGIKLHDKLGALDKLGKHLGLFTDKLEISFAPDKPLDEMTDEELTEYERKLAAASHSTRTGEA